MNIDIALDNCMDTANVGIWWIIFFIQISLSKRIRFTILQKTVIYAVLAVITFIVSAKYGIVIFDIIIFIYYLGFSIFFFYKAKHGNVDREKKEGEQA